MGQLVTDNFTRGDAGNLGANWTIVALTMQIVSNAAKSNQSFSNENLVYYSGASVPTGNDQYAECKITTLESGRDVAVGVLISGTSSANANAYLFVLNDNDAAITLPNNYSVALYKQVAGTFTQIGASVTGVALASGDLIRIERQGSAIRGLVNGVQKISNTDSALSSGNPGLYIGSGNNSIWDDFAAGDFSGASPFQIDWPLAPGPKRIALSLTEPGPYVLRNTAAATLPFQNDWPLPVNRPRTAARLSVAEYYTIDDNLPQPQQAYDWQIPKPAKVRSLMIGDPAFALLNTPSIPVANDWPLPSPRRPRQSLSVTDTPFALANTAGLKPFTNEWQLPTPRRPRATVSTTDTPFAAANTVVVPFVNDWPLVAPTRPGLRLSTVDTPFALANTVPPTPTVNDWPNPTPRRPRALLSVTDTPFALANTVVLPFVNDWPLIAPRRPRAVLSSAETSYALQNTAPSIPFKANEWPLARTRRSGVILSVDAYQEPSTPIPQAPGFGFGHRDGSSIDQGAGHGRSGPITRATGGRSG